MQLTFIGGGNMAAAMIGGLIEQENTAIRVVEPSESRRQFLLQTWPKLDVLPSLEGALSAEDCVVLAVKPQQLKLVCAELAGKLRGALVLSIAAGIPVALLSQWLGGHQRVVRIMPNTPAVVGLGVSGLFAGGISDADRHVAGEIMRSVGQVLWVDDESAIDAVTAITGSGPAYVFYLIEALRDAAIQQGFMPDIATELALATFEGAVKLARDSGEDPASLRQKVTSKGGTTERAIVRFQQEKISERLAAGVADCRARSEELGRILARDA